MTATLRHFSIEFDGSPSKPGETFIDCNRERWTVLRYTGVDSITSSSYRTDYEDWMAIKGPYAMHSGGSWRTAVGSHANCWLALHLVTALDVRRLTITRGKSREMEQYQPGRVAVDLDNRARDYDPLNLTGPYVSGGITQIRPGRRLRVKATHPTTLLEHDLFAGFTREWGMDYGKQDAVARPVATDALTDLARSDVDLTTTAGLSGVAIAEVLLDAGVAGYAADDGNSTLQAATFSGTAQEALRTLLNSEQGDLYAEANGVVTFKDRHSLLQEDRSTVSQATFGPEPRAFAEIDCVYESDLIRNSISAQRTGGVTQTAEDADSVRDYGKRSLSLTGLALASDTLVQDLANFMLAKRKAPAVRIRSITLLRDHHLNAYSAEMLSRYSMEAIAAPTGPMEVVTPADDASKK